MSKLEKRIGQRIRSARMRLGLTQEEVAARLGLSAVGYGGFERGACLPAPLPSHVRYPVPAQRGRCVHASAPPGPQQPRHGAALSGIGSDRLGHRTSTRQPRGSLANSIIQKRIVCYSGNRNAYQFLDVRFAIHGGWPNRGGIGIYGADGCSSGSAYRGVDAGSSDCEARVGRTSTSTRFQPRMGQESPRAGTCQQRGSRSGGVVHGGQDRLTSWEGRHIWANRPPHLDNPKGLFHDMIGIARRRVHKSPRRL